MNKYFSFLFFFCLHHPNGGNSMRNCIIFQEFYRQSISMKHCSKCLTFLKIISVSMESGDCVCAKDCNRITESKRTQFLCCCQMINCSTVLWMWWFFSFSSYSSFSFFVETLWALFLLFLYIHREELNTNAQRVTNYMQIQRTIAERPQATTPMSDFNAVFFSSAI